MRGVLALGFIVVFCTSPAARQKKVEEAERGVDSVHSSWYVFRREGLDTLRGRRWVLVLHRPTRGLVDSFLDLGIKVEAVYAPEHGLWGR